MNARILKVAGLIMVSGLLVVQGCGGDPVEVSGKWKVTSAAEPIEFIMDLKQTGTTIGGSMSMEGQSMRLDEGKLSENQLTFSYTIEGEGKVDWFLSIVGPEKMEGEAVTWEKGHEGEKIPVTANRVN